MVDIHSHILPGIDDGSKSLEMSVEMLRVAATSGTTDIVASPHSNLEFRFEPDVITEKIEELSEASGNIVRIHRGCDFHLHFDNIQDALSYPTKYAINNKNYLLVEFSDLLIAKTTDDIFYRLMSVGLIPIITHPERNALLQQRLEQLRAWVNQGAMIQVTALSLTGRWGKRTKRFADELMRQRLVHFVASDAHDPEYRPPSLKEAYEYIARHYSEQRAQELCVTNPQATLTGQELYFDEADFEPPKKWYQFWK